MGLKRLCDGVTTMEKSSTGDFIGLAIELGLIDPITNFVLAETLNSIERLGRSIWTGNDISLNVAAKQAGNLWTLMCPFMDSSEGEQIRRPHHA